MNNNLILDKVDEIIKKIESDPVYQKYLYLKEKMANHSEIVLLVNEIRTLQKDVVHHLNKKNILEEKINELNNDPLYREYNNTLYELNNVYSILETSINNYFSKKLN